MAKLKTDYIKWVLTLNATPAQEAYHNLEKENKELQKQSEATKKKMAELEIQGKKGSREWKNYNKALDENSRTMADNKAKMGELIKQFDKSSMTLGELKKHLKALNKEFENTSKKANPEKYKELRKQIDETKQAIYQATGQTDKLKNSFLSISKMKQTLMGFFAGIGMTVLDGVVNSFKNAFNIIVDFEKANSKLAAILGTTKEGIVELEKGARQLGATTSYSAAEVTGLQIELAKLGFSDQQILNMEGAVLKFAKAVDTDLSRASAFAGAALRIFNKDTKDTEEVLATFAIATTKTALDFSKLEASLATVGPVANAFGLSLEDTTALLGSLANAGFDASSAATATRNIILKLCDANGDLAHALGGPVKNAADLAKGLKKLNDEGVDLAQALELTDKRSVAAFSTFLNSADQLVPLRDSITGVTDDFNRMSETMADNVAGALAGLQSAAQELVLKISQETKGPIKNLIESLISIVNGVGVVIEYLQRFSTIIKAVTVAFLGYKAGVIATTIAVKAYNLVTKVSAAITSAYRTAVMLLQGGFKGLIAQIKTATASTQALKAAMMSTPWGAIIGAITSIIAVCATWGDSYDDVTSKTEKLNEEADRLIQKEQEHARKKEEFNEKLTTEKTKLLELVNIANDENAAKEKRLKAIAELNKLCPKYEGHLDAEGRKLKANTEALQEYINKMETRMRLAYYKDEYEKYIKEEEAAKQRLKKASPALEKAKRDFDEAANTLPVVSINKKSRFEKWLEKNLFGFNYDEGPKDQLDYLNLWARAEEEYDSANKALQVAAQNVADLKATIEEAGYSLVDVLAASDEPLNDLNNDLTGLNNVTEDALTKIKRLKQELKALRKADPQTMEEYNANKAQQEKIKKELKALEGKTGKKHRDYEDTIDAATAKADDLHQQNLLKINLQKGDKSEYDLAIARNEENLSYYYQLLEVLDELEKNENEKQTKDQKFLDEITKQRNKIAKDQLVAQISINKATADRDAELHKNKMTALQAGYEEEERILKEHLNNQEYTEGEAEVYLLARKRDLHQSQLAELKAYYEKTKNADYLGNEQKRILLEKVQTEINAMESQILTDTGKWQQMLREMMTDTTSINGITSVYNLKIDDIEKTYDAVIAIVKKSGEDTVALEEEKSRRIAALNYQYQEEMWRLKEAVGLTWADEYKRELDRLDNLYTQGLMKERDYQRKKLELGVKNVNKYFDYYAKQSGTMFSAIQDAEIALSDAKYDILIQQAKNNGAETEAIEQEKENKKLEIQKKYADVNFAIKISQIIADTAVAIMKAFAELGWIGGGIAAAMLTATSAAQIASAEAERSKIKNMQPGSVSGSSASSNTTSVQRVLNGFSDGGYTGNGNRYEVAGIVHKGEYVVPKPIMNNPRVVDAVGTIEAIRRTKIPGAAPSANVGNNGFADGGFTSYGAAANSSQELEKLLEELNATIKKGIPAYVVLRSFDEANSKLHRAQAPFTRSKS